MKTILVFNIGSSSVKASLLYPPSLNDQNKGESTHSFSSIKVVSAHGERLETEDSSLKIIIFEAAVQQNSSLAFSEINSAFDEGIRHGERSSSQSIAKVIDLVEPNLSHKAAIQMIIDKTNAANPGLLDSVVAVGHRVVHGATMFCKATIVDEDFFSKIESISKLAPLHNLANLEGIRIAMEVFKNNVPNIAVFDTAFHSTMPQHVYTYPIPKEYTQHQIRKYGFHGTSVKFISECAAKQLKELNRKHDRLIIAHLGNGASVTAIVDGKSVDTSMEFTPLSGIMMGTRSGSVDPSLITYASDVLEKTSVEVLDDLNKKSGLFAVSEGDNDMRVVLQKASKGDLHAKLAIEMYVHILAKCIAGLLVSCGGNIDAIIFTAGVGEHSPLIRKLTIDKLSNLLGGLRVDSEKNDAHGVNSQCIISAENKFSPIAMVMKTDEEAMICKECERILK